MTTVLQPELASKLVRTFSDLRIVSVAPLIAHALAERSALGAVAD